MDHKGSSQDLQGTTPTVAEYLAGQITPALA